MGAARFRPAGDLPVPVAAWEVARRRGRAAVKLPGDKRQSGRYEREADMEKERERIGRLTGNAGVQSAKTIGARRGHASVYIEKARGVPLNAIEWTTRRRTGRSAPAVQFVVVSSGGDSSRSCLDRASTAMRSEVWRRRDAQER